MRVTESQAAQAVADLLRDAVESDGDYTAIADLNLAPGTAGTAGFVFARGRYQYLIHVLATRDTDRRSHFK